ncbi:MAG: ABC transporter ATP-binding protein [Planctomycetota bacterium]
MTDLVGSDLSVQLGARRVLAGASCALRAGELVLLAGRNGAGKSTLLRTLLGAQCPSGGAVRLGGRPIHAWPGPERARQLAFVPQAIETPFEFTGRELVAMGRHPHRGRGAPLSADDRAAIAQALRDVDAEAFADRPVTTLSGGEQRRIAVARALATRAPLLLLDEPTNCLDLEHALQLVALLRRLCAQGRGCLVASHDLNLFAPAAHRVVVLHDGRVAADAPPEQALAPALLRSVFGVDCGPAGGGFPRAFRLPG